MLRTYDDKTHVAVPKSALDWLNGESGEFDCPHDLYFRGNPPNFWWRGVFREKIAAAPPPATNSDVAKDAERWRTLRRILDRHPPPGDGLVVVPRSILEKIGAAIDEELGAWDIDPPLAHLVESREMISNLLEGSGGA